MNSPKIKLTFDINIPVRLHNAIYKDINDYCNHYSHETFFLSDCILTKQGKYHIPNWVLHKGLSQGLLNRQPNVGKKSLRELKRLLCDSLWSDEKYFMKYLYGFCLGGGLYVFIERLFNGNIYWALTALNWAMLAAFALWEHSKQKK